MAYWVGTMESVGLIARALRALSIVARALALVMTLGTILVKAIAPALALASRLVVASTFVAIAAVGVLVT